MKRGGPLQRRSRLRSISAKGRAKRAQETAQVSAEGLAFKREIKAERCVVCHATEAIAKRDSGYGHVAHHAISQQRLKKLGLADRLWDPRLAVCLCEEPCHRRETSGKRRVKLGELPPRVFRFIRSVQDEDGIDLRRYLPTA